MTHVAQNTTTPEANTQTRRPRRCQRLGALLGLSLLGASAAAGLEIELIDVGATPMTAEQTDAFEMAADRWESRFSDPVTVRIEVAFNNLEAGILGSTRTTRTSCPFSAVRDAMMADADSTERLAIRHLPDTSLLILDVNGNRLDSTLTLATANAKALGLGTAPDEIYPDMPAGIDAQITFNTNFATTFDYDPGDGIAWNRTDFVAVAAHEIGHALGFFSLTDVQDGNASFTLHPNTLDLFRFEETGEGHDLETERRRVTAGDVEYFDLVLNHVPLSHGTAATDPDCAIPGGSCQASHWSDDQGFLMDPTIANGVEQDIEDADVHALDYIGWNRGEDTSVIIDDAIFGWFSPEYLLPELLPEFGGVFDPYPMPPIKILPMPFPGANVAVRVGWSLGVPGLDGRSGLGYARFESATPVAPVVLEGGPQIEGQMVLDPTGEPVTVRPPALHGLRIESDTEAGTPFVFTAACALTGCQYDPTIGELGGYRVPGFLDGTADETTGDIDAFVTLILHADELLYPNPEAENLFSIAEGDNDNRLTVKDEKALGVARRALRQR